MTECLQKKLEQWEQEHQDQGDCSEYGYGYRDAITDFKEAVSDIASSIEEDIKRKKVDLLEMFCQQGPPTKHWIKTKGQFWKGWNEACNQIIPMIREKLLVGSSPSKEAKQ